MVEDVIFFQNIHYVSGAISILTSVLPATTPGKQAERAAPIWDVLFVLKVEGNRLVTKQKLSEPLCSSAVSLFPSPLRSVCPKFLYRL